MESLRAEHKVVIHLQLPAAGRIQVSTDGAPVRGSPEAAVTIVEFSNFECPFCKQAQLTIMQLLERYNGKVKLVYRDFPLDSIHPQARRAAEAARCAHDQGNFWDFHDLLFSEAKMAPEDLRQYASKMGLDTVKFDSCVSNGTHKFTVQRDLDEGTRLGITGTPAFFINGRMISGAQSFEAFARIIDDELAR